VKKGAWGEKVGKRKRDTSQKGIVILIRGGRRKNNRFPRHALKTPKKKKNGKEKREKFRKKGRTRAKEGEEIKKKGDAR